MTGSGIKSAMVVRGNLGEPEIDFTLDAEGADKFAQITRENVDERLAIILDRELYSAPVIQTPIETGSGQITGHFDNKEAFELANVLENPLRAPGAHQRIQRSGPDPGPRLDPQRHQGGHLWHAGGLGLHAGLLPDRRHGGQRGAHRQHHHPAGRHVLRRHDADAARHRRHRADRRYGGGCQRADLRTHPRGNGQGQVLARRDCRRLQPRLRHHFRLARHDAHFVGHPDGTWAPAQSKVSAWR